MAPDDHDPSRARAYWAEHARRSKLGIVERLLARKPLESPASA